MRPTILFCLILVALNTPAGQSNGSGSPSEVTIRAGAEEVMLDVVVRDKKGRGVLDLEPGDLLVLDNGVERKVTSFKLIQGQKAFSAATPESRSESVTAVAPSVAKLDPLRQFRLVTLIFNRLDLNARTIARTAALDLLKNEFPQNVYLGVLVLGDSLQAIQPFTNDLSLLRKAVERATGGAYTRLHLRLCPHRAANERSAWARLQAARAPVNRLRPCQMQPVAPVAKVLPAIPAVPLWRK